MTKSTTEVEEIAPNSRKREVTAVVIATAVGVVLTVASGVLINKVQNRVKQHIAPTTETD